MSTRLSAETNSGVARFRCALVNELIKLFARPRTYIGFGVFLSFEIVVLSMLKLPKSQAAFERLLEANGYLFAEYFSGQTLAITMIAAVSFFLGALYLALVAGDIVAKEVEDGTLRMILNRPVSRTRLLAVKWITCLIYTLVLMLFLGISGVLTGVLFQGWGSVFFFAGAPGIFAVFPPWEGLFRILAASMIIGLFFCTISSIGFFFSCLPVKPAAATVLTLSFFFADFVLQNLPYFADYQHFFISYHTSQWVNVFVTPFPAHKLMQSMTLLWALNLSFFIISTAYFSQRDFKA